MEGHRPSLAGQRDARSRSREAVDTTNLHPQTLRPPEPRTLVCELKQVLADSARFEMVRAAAAREAALQPLHGDSGPGLPLGVERPSSD